jgi:hypothetical protein
LKKLVCNFEFSADVDLLVQVVKDAGYQVDRYDVFFAWKEASTCAGGYWLAVGAYPSQVVLDMLRSWLVVEDHPVRRTCVIKHYVGRRFAPGC